MTLNMCTELPPATGTAADSVMPLQDFLTKVSPAHGGTTWGEVVQTMLANDADATIVSELRRELAANGRFESPIQVDQETRSVVSGMHRIVALILTSAATVEYTCGTRRNTPRRGRRRGAGLRGRVLTNTRG